MPLEITLLVDASASMTDIRDPINTAIARFVARLRRAGDSFITVATFATDYRVLVHRANVRDFQWLPDRYHPCGETALLDAMAHAVLSHRNRAKGGLVVVVSDGEENASVRYHQNFGAVMTIIERARLAGVRFSFLGLTPTSVDDALRMGLREDEITRAELPGHVVHLLPQAASPDCTGSGIALPCSSDH